MLQLNQKIRKVQILSEFLNLINFIKNFLKYYILMKI
jgi:hypothetical protein